MDGAELELERRSRFLSGLIEKKKATEQHIQYNVSVRASDVPIPLQARTFRCARDLLHSMLPAKLSRSRSQKEFDEAYGPARHCAVGTSFGYYVAHSEEGFLYFSIDKVYILHHRRQLA